MAEPFISPLGLTITPALSYEVVSADLDLRNRFMYLEVEEDTVSPTPCLALADDNSGHR